MAQQGRSIGAVGVQTTRTLKQRPLLVPANANPQSTHATYHPSIFNPRFWHVHRTVTTRAGRSWQPGMHEQRDGHRRNQREDTRGQSRSTRTPYQMQQQQRIVPQAGHKDKRGRQRTEQLPGRYDPRNGLDKEDHARNQGVNVVLGQDQNHIDLFVSL